MNTVAALSLRGPASRYGLEKQLAYSNSYPSMRRTSACSLSLRQAAAPPNMMCRPLLNSVFKLSSAYC